jgi:hypothetical protein
MPVPDWNSGSPGQRRPAAASPPASEPSGPSRRGLRVLLVPLGAAGLLALAAVGALRSPPPQGNGQAHFPTALVESLLLLTFVFVLLALVAAVYALGPDHRRRRMAARRSSWTLLLFPLLLTLAFWALRHAPRRWLHLLPTPPTAAPSQPQPGSTGGLSHPQAEWLPVLLLGGLLLAVAAGLLYGAWRRRRQLQPPSPRELAALLGEVLIDVEAETDPRRAVIAAWVGMERRLAAAGLPRDPAETPLEYVARILDQVVPVTAQPVRTLADLFEQAKFSDHLIHPGMRAQALAALRAIREDLEAAVAEEAAATTAALENRGAAWRAQ